MSIYIPNEAVITDFIRENVTDPNSNRTYLEDSTTITSGTSQSEYTITAPSGSVSHVTNVTVDGVNKTKWEDYVWDYKGSKVIFYTDKTPADGVDVVVTFKYGSTNWAYADLPDKRMGEDSFPRIRVFKASQTGQRLGNYKAPVESSIRFQVDIWTVEKQPFTVDGIGNSRSYSGEALAEILSREIQNQLEDNIDDLYPIFYDYELNNSSYQGFVDDRQKHHYIFEFTLKTSCNGLIN